VRVFLAVPGDPDWCASAREFGARWRPRLPPASWTKPESWHLTLRFLGEIDEEAAARFADAIGASTEVPDVALPPGGPVVFPPHGRPRVVGVGFAPGAGVDAVAGVARTAERAARSIGCAPEERPYRPHVTLARLREPWGRGAVEAFREAAGAWPFPEWRVRAVVLYSSRLDPSGAVHTPLREWPEEAEARGKTA
jgi:2'-5' RNA ligase